MKKIQEWQRFNLSEQQQIGNAIAFVEISVLRLNKKGFINRKYIFAIDYPQSVVDQVQAHFNADDRAITIQRSFKRTGGFQCR